MASIPGGQFTFSAVHQPVNLVVTASGASLPPPISGDFNLEVITAPIGTSYPLPPGYQGVALLSQGGYGLDMLRGSYSVAVTGSGADTVQGGAGNDTITGGTGPELIQGGHGNDLIQGGTGPDTIYGGAGNDTITGGTGPDTIAGGPGHNDIYMGTGPDLVQDTGPGGHDTVFGFGHNDHMSFVGEDPNSIQHVVATAEEHNGNTTVTLPDGSSITLVGITHINSGSFH
jgi:Ca2+-binding RTX toxin-like protein